MKATDNLIIVQAKRIFKLPLTKKQLASIIDLVLKQETPRSSWEVECLFTDDAAISKLNAKYRHRQGSTDVLSFLLTDIGDFSSEVEFPAIPGMRPNLGQIVISYQTALRQAAQHSRDVTQELILLLVHGALHLAGHDHRRPAEARKMHVRERKYIGLIDRIL